MSRTVVETLSHHMTAFIRSDVDSIMENYTDGSVLFSPDGVLEGRDLIRSFYVNLTGTLLPPGSTFQSVRQDRRGDTVFLLWQAESPVMKFHLAAETLVIRDGKIVTHSFAAAVEPKE